MPRLASRLALMPILALIVLLFSLPAIGLASELLNNPGLNNSATYVDTGRDWRTFDEKVANGWWYYYVDNGTYKANNDAPKLHWMSSQQFAQAFGGLDYFREGDASQVIWSSYDFDAGIYQQVSGLTIGQDYAFEVAMASFWRGSQYPITDGYIKKCIGIDPYGGTDPTASTVIWDWDDCDTTDKSWPYLDMAATAQATTMTVFARIQSPENDSDNHTDLNYVFIDDGRFGLAPTVTLTAPAASDVDVFLQWDANTAPGWTLQGVEVQYKDHADGVWHTIQDRSATNTSYTLTGQPGHTYTIRARPWQEKDNYDLHGQWVAKQVQVGGAYAGYVHNNFGVGISGALISATGASTNSGPKGFYGLRPLTFGQPYTLTVDKSGYQSPYPISASVANNTSITPITFTLKPANDAINNGDFESNISGWTKAGAGSATITGTDHRSGDASLAIDGPYTLTQAVVVTNGNNPTLSFWYKPALNGNESLQVSLTGGAMMASKIFTAGPSGGWQHAWIPLNRSGLYSGPLTVSFHLTGGQVLLDEVSLGDGPHTIFLPIVFRAATP